MSGPIVRKYGFPNFEKIFGPKPVLHGVDEDSKSESAPEPSSTDPQAEAPSAPPAEKARPSS